MTRVMTRAVILLTLVAGTLTAQRGRARAMPPMPRPDSARGNRDALQQQVRQRLGQRMREELNLSDAQMTRLQETNRKYAEKRRLLSEQERDIRMSLRDELIGGDSTHQKQINELMDRMLKVQRQRLDLVDQEQKDLGAFLTPMQRAQYFGFEERVRQQMQQLRQQGQGRGGPPGPDMPPGGMGMGQRGDQPAPNCDQLTPQQRRRLEQRRASGQPIPPRVAACLPPDAPPQEPAPPA